MAHKTLTISEEAYNRLARARQRGDESFTEVIIRLTSSRANLPSYAGAWKDLKDEEIDGAFGAMREAWKRWRPR